MEKYKIIGDGCYIGGWKKGDVFEATKITNNWYSVKTINGYIIPQFIEGKNIEKYVEKPTFYVKDYLYKDGEYFDGTIYVSNNCDCNLYNGSSLSNNETKKMSDLRNYIWDNFMMQIEDEISEDVEFIEEKQDEIDSTLVCLSIISAKSDDVIDEIEDAIENKDKLGVKELMKKLSEKKEIYKTDSYKDMIKSIKKFLKDNGCNDGQD